MNNKIFKIIKSKNKFSNIVAVFFKMVFKRDINFKVLQIINEENLITYLDTYKSSWSDFYSQDSASEYNSTIWTCWLQGVNDAPDMVSKCIESMRKTGKDVIVLDKYNFKKYVDIPRHIIEKWKKGIITNTHLSDILRVMVLNKHGGCWMDSTVYISESVNSHFNLNMIFANDFFIIKAPLTIESPRICSSWLIRAKKNNQIVGCVERLLLAYWEKNDDIRDYFLLHMCFNKVIERADNKKKWNEVPYYDDSYSNLLRFFQNEVFDKKIWDDIKSKTNIHKLNRKYVVSDLDCSFYNKIINKK